MAGVAIGDEGFTLVEIDYSNAENVMAAMIAGDSNLSAACQAEDFHSVMGAEYFGKQWQEADTAERKRLRNLSKKITYGTAYGMGAKRLGESINVSTEEAKRIMRAKDAAFPRVTHWRTVAQKQADDTHRLKLWTGRPVAVPSAFVAWNYICQGGGERDAQAGDCGGVGDLPRQGDAFAGGTGYARRADFGSGSH